MTLAIYILLLYPLYTAALRGYTLLKASSIDSTNGNRPFGNAILDTLWKLPIFRSGQQGSSPTTFGDAAQVLKYNILEVYGKNPSYDGAPIAKGEVKGLLEGSLFLGLQAYFREVSKLWSSLYINHILSSNEYSHV